MGRLEDYREIITYSTDSKDRLGIDELLLLLAELIDDPQISEVVDKYIDDFYDQLDENYKELLTLRSKIIEKDLNNKGTVRVPIFQIINKESQLSKLTGLNHEELWEHGFNLDDWDYCVVSNKVITNAWLLSIIENYCCGCELVEYNNNYYYMLYHA